MGTTVVGSIAAPYIVPAYIPGTGLLRTGRFPSSYDFMLDEVRFVMDEATHNFTFEPMDNDGPVTIYPQDEKIREKEISGSKAIENACGLTVKQMVDLMVRSHESEMIGDAESQIAAREYAVIQS